MPGTDLGQDPTDTNMYWSMSFGGSYLHLIGSNTESILNKPLFDEVETDWLVKDLHYARAIGMVCYYIFLLVLIL